MKKLYVVSNYGEYVSSHCKDSTVWSCIILDASIFTSYQKAYSLMRLVNNSYGYTRCVVERLNPDDWSEYCWKQLENKAS